MRALVEHLNGKLLLEKRFLQFVPLCERLGITPIRATFRKESSWLVGFIDAEGSIGINSCDQQPSISAGQKTREVLDAITPV